jgi:hypothetical protein
VQATDYLQQDRGVEKVDFLAVVVVVLGMVELA